MADRRGAGRHIAGVICRSLREPHRLARSPTVATQLTWHDGMQAVRS
jgi:hypothetical protein